MLQQLSIRNLALIEALDIDLQTGLSVLTGETGAGKSVIFLAMGLLLGQRATIETIRDGQEQGSVTGVFEPRGEVAARIARKLEDAGMPAGDTLIIRRVLNRQGRHRAWLNEIPTTVTFLADVVGEMMEIVGQHQHLTLIQSDAQRAMIDRWAGNQRELMQMHDAYRAWKQAMQERKALETARSERVERLEFARFQREEISALNLREGEYEELELEVKRTRYAEKLREGYTRASYALYRGDGAAVEKIGEACDALRRLEEYEPSLGAVRERLEEMEMIINDVSRDLDGKAGGISDEQDIDTLVSRHEALRVAMRRFSLDEAGLLERLTSLNEEVHRLENLEVCMDEAEAKERAARTHAETVADTIDRIRARAAAELFEQVARALGELEMPSASLTWSVVEDEPRKLASWGWDNHRILFSANAGERVLPLGKVASGGELSRLLLALKSVMMDRDPIPLCLFDEIDTGLGGQAGVAVGHMLRGVSEHRQIMCITHLPQIAACADQQYLVQKQVDEGRTVSSIQLLDGDAREREIARMLGGHAQEDVSLAHARAMLGS